VKHVGLNDSKDAGESPRVDSEIPGHVKESFEVGREDNNEMPNIWFPDGILPGFKEACLEFYWVGCAPQLALVIHTAFSTHCDIRGI